MFYISVSDKRVVTMQTIKSQHPQTSFPSNPTDEDLAPYGYASLKHTQPPTYDDTEFYLSEGEPECIEGKWQTSWLVLPLEQDESMQRKIARYDSALTEHLDSVAKQRRYDDRITCAVRAGYPGPFQAECIAFASWMDQCNAIAYSILEEVMNGERPAPVSPEAFIAELPAMVWPDK